MHLTLVLYICYAFVAWCFCGSPGRKFWLICLCFGPFLSCWVVSSRFGMRVLCLVLLQLLLPCSDDIPGRLVFFLNGNRRGVDLGEQGGTGWSGRRGNCSQDVMYERINKKINFSWETKEKKLWIFIVFVHSWKKNIESIKILLNAWVDKTNFSRSV